jgi:hypothetical protein
MWMIGHLFSLRGVTPERPVWFMKKTACAPRGFWLDDLDIRARTSSTADSAPGWLPDSQ